MPRVHPAVFLALAILSLAACEQKAPEPAVPTAAQLAADAAQAGLHAAAEPFKALTKTAFTAKPVDLDKAIAAAMASAERARPALPAEAKSKLKAQLDAIAAARPAGDRAGIALASVEVYRLLASLASPGPTPVEVNFLDYAGLRYDAGLKARPLRWEDMIEAAAFGQEKWSAIANGVTDAALRQRMSSALTDMAVAAQRKDATLAAGAATRELALVDLLEAYAASHATSMPH